MSAMPRSASTQNCIFRSDSSVARGWLKGDTLENDSPLLHVFTIRAVATYSGLPWHFFILLHQMREGGLVEAFLDHGLGQDPRAILLRRMNASQHYHAHIIYLFNSVKNKNVGVTTPKHVLLLYQMTPGCAMTRQPSTYTQNPHLRKSRGDLLKVIHCWADVVVAQEERVEFLQAVNTRRKRQRTKRGAIKEKGRHREC